MAQVEMAYLMGAVGGILLAAKWTMTFAMRIARILMEAKKSNGKVKSKTD